MAITQIPKISVQRRDTLGTRTAARTPHHAGHEEVDEHDEQDERTEDQHELRPLAGSLGDGGVVGDREHALGGALPCLDHADRHGSGGFVVPVAADGDHQHAEQRVAVPAQKSAGFLCVESHVAPRPWGDGSGGPKS